MHTIAAKAVCFAEALKPEFKEYGKKIVQNSKTLAVALMEKGHTIISGDTDNHMFLMDLRNSGITGKELEKRLDDVYITVNKNTIPNEPLSPFVTSGIRIGTAAVTTRGLGEADMKKIAELIDLTIRDYENNISRIQSEVTALCEKYPIY